MRTLSRNLILAVSLAVAAGTLVTPAAAQAREGFYLSAGIGWGYFYQRCGSCLYSTDNTDNYVYYLGFGTTVKPNLRVGFEADAYNKTKNSQTQNVVFYNLMASFYPRPQSNLWIKLGLGWTTNDLAGDQASGVNFATGIGLDLGKKLAIIPYVMYDYQFTGGDVNGVNVKVSLLQFGVGFGLRH